MDNATSPSLFLSVAEMAAELRMAPKTLRNHISAGDFPIPSHRVMGKRLFLRADLVAFSENLSPSQEQPKNAIPAETAAPAPRRGRGRPRLINPAS